MFAAADFLRFIEVLIFAALRLRRHAMPLPLSMLQRFRYAIAYAMPAAKRI